jgi:hypothetical protein
MTVIKVPKTPRKAYNPDRIASGLIQAQIQHLEAAAGLFPAKRARRARLRTEGESADYIAQLTAQIYARAGASPGPELAVPQPPTPIAGTPTETSTTRQGTAAPRPATPRVTTAPKSRPRSTATRRPPAARRKKPTRVKGRRGRS